MYEYDPSEFDESETLVVEEDKRQTPINFEIQKANTPLSNRLIEVPDSTKKITSAESDVLFNIPKAKNPVQMVPHLTSYQKNLLLKTQANYQQDSLNKKTSFYQLLVSTL